MKRLASILASAAALFSISSARADVKLPAIISDHMVLQQDVSAPVWGWADGGEKVEVSIAGQTKSVTPLAGGKWMVKLDPLKSGGPHEMTVKGRNTITVKDVLVGEVWLGSGQSNMAFVVQGSSTVDQAKAAADLPQVRMFTVTSKAADTPQSDCEGKWEVCSSSTVGRFSATLFFCGREIHLALKVPVGLIHSSVGGTPIESWISAEAQDKSPELKAFFEAVSTDEAHFDAVAAKAKYDRELAAWKEAVKKARAEKKPLPRAPRDPLTVRTRKGNVGGLFNGKIAPLIPYAIRGTLWYQGEANSTALKAPFYQLQLPLLVQDWRARWGGEFPFAWVQLPNFDGPGRDWPTVREAMLKTLKLPKTGMAITIDLGEAKNIHPKNKEDVGDRLAAWALGTVYGRKVAAISGPLPAGHEIRGSEVVLAFTHTDGGLVAKDGALLGFAIAGEDKKWLPAKARVEGEKVIVSSPEVAKPAAVRYAWENNPVCNLYNGAGIPASPFRTDDWPSSPAPATPAPPTKAKKAAPKQP